MNTQLSIQMETNNWNNYNKIYQNRARPRAALLDIYFLNI